MSHNKQNKHNQRLYEQFVNGANNIIKSNQESQDKMILAISVALFGLMPFLLEKLPNNDSLTNVLVIVLLIFNSLSLVFVIFSFLLSIKGTQKDISYAEEYYLENKEKSFNKQSKYTKYGRKCNEFSLIAVLITLLSLAIILGRYFIVIRIAYE